MNRLWRILLLERNTTVVASPGAESSQRLAITFDFWRDTDEKALPKAYGETFFAKRDIGQVHVFAHWNHFFPVEEMDRVLEVVAGVASEAETRILYGSSMGGSAALSFSERLEADIVIAVAPHFDPTADEDARAIERYNETSTSDGIVDPFRRETLDRIRLPSRTYVIFDPGCQPDVAEVDAIRQHHQVIPIHCLHGGHWPDLALRNAGLLSEVVSSVIEGTLDLPAVYELSDSTART